MGQTVFQCTVPVNEVGGTVDGVDDPSGIVCQDAGSTCCYWLLTYEASESQTEETKNVSAVNEWY